MSETNEKLNAAFRELRNKHNLIARQRFSCCLGCGMSEMGHLVDELEKAGKPPPAGGCFYHQQDAEERDRYNDFYLVFFSIEEDGTAAEVAKTIRAVLKKHGIETRWNGDVRERIRIVAASIWDEKLHPGYRRHVQRYGKAAS